MLTYGSFYSIAYVDLFFIFAMKNKVI